MLTSYFHFQLPVLALISAILYFPFALIRKRRLGPRPMVRHITLFAMVGYVLSLLYLTILWYWPEINFHLGYYLLNLRPFIWLNETYEMGAGKMLSQLLLNILMFVPLGLLLPMTFTRMRAFWKTALTALCATVAIETVQYFIGRSADIDDVIMNVIGGMLGYALFGLCNRLLQKSGLWRKALG